MTDDPPVVDERPVTVQTAILTDVASMQAFADQTVTAPPAAVGAVVTFAGVVRDHDDGRSVRELEYEAHPSAATVLDAVAREVAARHPAAQLVRMAHRAGLLAIGDAALYAEVGAAHRADAFAACAELVEQVKRVLPVWKRQVFDDGTSEWVNSP